MEMVENVNGGEEEKQERSERHARAHIKGDANHREDQENSKNKLSEGNYKHPYYLRAKTNRFVGYRVIKEDRDKNESMGLIKMNDKFDDRGRYSASSEEEDLANCLVMLSNKSCALSNKEEIVVKAKQVEIKGMFQCKSCKKIFNSHQALGGHRASHKKVKGCFAAKLDNPNNDIIEQDSIVDTEDDDVLTLESRDSYSKKRSKAHECSVCRRVFSSGQALGGHKRCHWLTTTSVDNAFIRNFHELQYDNSRQLYEKPTPRPNPNPKPNPTQLDLNLPPRLLDNVTADNTTSTYEDSTRLHLQQWGKGEVLSSIANQNQHKIQRTNTEIKLCDLRDKNLDGVSSNWLQVGIASTTDIY